MIKMHVNQSDKTCSQLHSISLFLFPSLLYLKVTEIVVLVPSTL